MAFFFVSYFFNAHPIITTLVLDIAIDKYLYMDSGVVIVATDGQGSYWKGCHLVGDDKCGGRLCHLRSVR